MKVQCAIIFALAAICRVWAADTTSKSYEVMTKEYDVQDTIDVSKKTKRRGVAAIIFRDAQGHEVKRATFMPGDVSEKGKRKSRRVDILENKERNHIVVSEQEVLHEERNPYNIRASSNTHVLWYAADGTVKCDLRSHDVPKIMSADGRTLVVTNIGFDPVDFEKLHDVPGLRSTSQLKKDPSLTSSYLHAINDRCRIIFSTTSLQGGWNIVMISPTGKWLLLEENESGVVQPGGSWINFLKAIDLEKQQTYLLAWDRVLTPYEIDDAGTLAAWKYAGPGKKTHKVKFYGGIEKEVPFTKYVRYVRRLGDADFQQTADEKEE